MIVVRTTAYYKPHFGTIMPDMKSVGYSGNDEVFEYTFDNKTYLYEWLNISKLKIRGGAVYKGSTVIGAYEWNEDVNAKPRPPRKNTKKRGKPKRKRK